MILKMKKNMRRFNILIGMLLLYMVSACSEADREMFEETAAINFDIPLTSSAITEYRKLDSTLIFREDTMVYSFAFDLELQEREICVPVEITGFASDKDRKYIVEVEEMNGAKAGVHYEPISREQILGKGKTRDSLRIKFYRKDMDQPGQARKLGLRIKSGGDFIEGIEERLFVAVQVSDILEEPSWWKKWIGCFGMFHPIKYREWMKLYGGTGDLTDKDPDWWSAPLELTLILDLKALFEREEFYDGDTRLVIPCTH